MPIHDLISLMEKFVSGEAISLADARKLESAVLESVPEHPDLEDLGDELARYQPEGGDLLFDYAQMKPRVAWHLESLRAR